MHHPKLRVNAQQTVRLATRIQRPGNQAKICIQILFQSLLGTFSALQGWQFKFRGPDNDG